MDYPSLPKSYKGLFPFRICSTSFVYPDFYAPNVKMLGPFLDEMELLFFESDYDGALPSGEQVEELRTLLTQFDMSCNVHLPLDVSLGDGDDEKRCRAVKTIGHVLELTAPLSPSTYTVHLTWEERSRSLSGIESWRGRLLESLEKILEKTAVLPGKFSAENLVDYPFEWVDEVIAKSGVHVCLDIGHLIERGEDFVKHFFKYRDKIDILHIYGVDGEKDHLALNRLAPRQLDGLSEILKGFSGVVSVEVFSFENLRESLRLLEKLKIS